MREAESSALSIRWCSTNDVGIKYSYENKENGAKIEVSATSLFQLMARDQYTHFKRSLDL